MNMTSPSTETHSFCSFTLALLVARMADKVIDTHAASAASALVVLLHAVSVTQHLSPAGGSVSAFVVERVGRQRLLQAVGIAADLGAIPPHRGLSVSMLLA